MKTKVFIAMCLLAGTAAIGNTIVPDKPVETGKNKMEAFTPPVFSLTKLAVLQLPGENQFLFNSYLRENVEYPEVALKYNIQGTQVVRFTVAANGDVTNLKVINSVCPEIDEEVMMALDETSGMWEPGLKGGLPSDMEREISIVFKIDGFKNGTENDYFKEQATTLFKKGSKALITKNNPEKALKYFNRALKYLPNESTLLYSRGMAKHLLNDIEGAQADWNRVEALAERNAGEKLPFITEIKEMEKD